MLGSLRLLLASLVAANHASALGLSPLNLWPAVMAVVDFYIVSGFVMTLLWRKYYVVPRRAPAYYADRCLRLMPQYYFFAAIALAAYCLGMDLGLNMSGKFGWDILIANLLIVPLNYQGFSERLYHFALVPQAWSLGVEFLFYAVVPWLVTHRRLRLWAGAISFLLFTISAFSPDPDDFGYRLFPSVLVFFIYGAVMAEAPSRGRNRFLIGGYVAFLGLAAALASGGKLWESTNPSVLLGFLIGAPVVYLVTRVKSSALDDMLGSASYGTYLCHVLVIFSLRDAHILQAGGIANKVGFVGLAVLGSNVVGYLAFVLVEHPVMLFRRRLRQRALQTRAPAAGSAEAEGASVSDLIVPLRDAKSGSA